jgi:Raf kinase inhibitor-like YbhB/YbcL family protein
MRTFAFGTGLVACGLGYAGAASALTLTSTDIKPGGRIASEQAANLFGCTSPNVSPALAWSGAPKATKSFAISMYDPDAPTGSGFWHWWVVDIPPDVTSLPKGAGSGAGLPVGAMQGRNDYSTASYGGPCPPPGKPHRYIITVYALGVDKLDVDQNVSPAVIGFNANAHTLAKATLTSLYGR